MTEADMKILERIALRQNALARQFTRDVGRMEKLLKVRSEELSNESLEAVTAKLASFRKELDTALAMLPRHAKIEGELATAKQEVRKELESKVAHYEAKRLEMIRQYEIQQAESKAGMLADTFRGNWDASTLYRRGETFSFRGGWHLVLQEARGQMPGTKNMRGAAPVYALLAAPGAPGPAGANGASGGGGGGDMVYVPPPLVSAGSTRGQWTFSSGYMYLAVADGTVRRWAVTTPP